MLIQADAFHLPYRNEYFHAIIFSPPYWGLRKYQGDQGDEPFGLESTPERHIERSVEYMREVRRVLRPDGVVWMNIGDCYGGSWGNYGSRDGGQRSQNTDALDRPGWENNTTRPPTSYQKAGSLMLMPHRLAIALQQPFMECKGCGHVAHQAEWGRFPNGRFICPSCEKSKGWTEETPGWIVRNDLVWFKRNPMPESVAGWRWTAGKPCGCATEAREEYIAGVMEEKGMERHRAFYEDGGHDRNWSDPECKDCAGSGIVGEPVLRKSSWRHTRQHEYVFMLVKKMGYQCNQEVVREGNTAGTIKRLTSAPIQPICEHQKNIDLGKGRDYGNRENFGDTILSGRNPRSVLDVPTAPYKGAHYATFPPKLIAPLIRASVPRRCCPECGMAWAPVVEQHYHNDTTIDGRPAKGNHRVDAGQATMASGERTRLISNVTDYRPTCECGVTEHEPGIVLDIFGGSGTTGMVAKQLMRRWVVMDISRPYLDEQAKVRTGSGTPSKALEGLPMFGKEQDDE